MGIAIGAVGTHVVIETADVTLMNDGFGVELSRHSFGQYPLLALQQNMPNNQQDSWSRPSEIVISSIQREQFLRL